MSEKRESSPQVSDLGKLRSIVRPDTLSAIAGWCRPQRPGLVLLCLCNVSYSLLTLGIPLLTRSLVDSAVNRSTALLWRYGLMLGLLIAAERCAAFLISWVGTKVSADLQQNLQRMTLQELFDNDLRSDLIGERYITPIMLQDTFNSYMGAAWGFDPNQERTEIRCLPNRCPDIGNLYLVGSGAHPGPFLPGVLQGAEIAYKQIISDRKDL